MFMFTYESRGIYYTSKMSMYWGVLYINGLKVRFLLHVQNELY
jgi:hypothetical protein